MGYRPTPEGLAEWKQRDVELRLDKTTVMREAIECGFAISTAYGQAVDQLMPVSDVDTLMQFAKAMHPQPTIKSDSTQVIINMQIRIDQLDAENEQLRGMVEMMAEGLQWRIENDPPDLIDDSDHEVLAKAKQVLGTESVDNVEIGPVGESDD